MLNQVEDCIFSRVFPIYEKPAKEGDYNVGRIKEQSFEQKLPDMRKVSGQKESLSLTFYPEGGNLVAGLSSRVAFSAIDRNGENATISGEIVNANNVKVAEFHTTHWGMGAFRFTPQAETYQARVQYNHKEYKFNLPRVEPTGYVLTVNSTDNKLLQVRVQLSTQLTGDTLGISLVCRGRLYAAGYIIPPNQSSFSVSKRAIPSGVSQLTLFNKQGEIVCERLICLNHHPEMKVRVETEKKRFAPMKKSVSDFN